MLRRFVCASVIVVLGLGVAMADTFTARITKVENGKVTFVKGKKSDNNEPVTLPTSADVKVTTGGKYNRDTKEVENAKTVTEGLKSPLLSNEKGVRARITTDADNKNITAIYISTFKGKKKKNNQ